MEGRVEKEVILHEMKFENDYKEFLKEKKIREQPIYTFPPEYRKIFQEVSES